MRSYPDIEKGRPNLEVVSLFVADLLRVNLLVYYQEAPLKSLHIPHKASTALLRFRGKEEDLGGHYGYRAPNRFCDESLGSRNCSCHCCDDHLYIIIPETWFLHLVLHGCSVRAHWVAFDAERSLFLCIRPG